MTDIEARLKAAGLTLPKPAAPVANYVPVMEAEGVLYVSGQLPMGPDGLAFRGKVGADCDVETAIAAARLCAINVIAQIRAALGGFERFDRVAKVTGFINAVPDFVDHSKIMNGASDLLVEILGDAGRHARSSIGVGSLPLGAPVEVEAFVRVRQTAM